MDLSERLDLVARDAAEVITKDELQTLLETNDRPRAYWGFELSGMMHVGMGLVCGRKIRDMVEAGFAFTIFLADWHSWINNKLGGKMENIKACGEYFQACFRGLGIPDGKVRYVWASELAALADYWERVVRIAKGVTISRVRRTLPIMGRDMEASDIETAAVYYPCMQAADIFQMDLDVACAGIDQRKAHMLARDIARKLDWKTPSCVHTPLLMGLTGKKKMEAGKFDEDPERNRQIASKMSKSLPETTLIVHDPPEVIRKRIRDAFCPEKEIESNPILEFARLMVLPYLGSMNIDRPAKFGGPVAVGSASELEKLYRAGKIHPLDLKNAVAESLIQMLSGVREEFERNPQPLENMRKIEITR